MIKAIGVLTVVAIVWLTLAVAGIQMAHGKTPCENGNPTDLCGGDGGDGGGSVASAKANAKATAIGVGVGIGVGIGEGGNAKASASVGDVSAQGGTASASLGDVSAQGGNATGGAATANSGGNAMNQTITFEQKRQAPGVALGAARSTANCRAAGGVGGSGPGFGFGVNGSVMDENCAYLEASNHAAWTLNNPADAHYLACQSEYFNKAPSCRKYDAKQSAPKSAGDPFPVQD